MKNIFKGKTKRAAIISSAAAICLVLAGATVYAVNVTGQNAAVSADTSISKAVSEGAQSYESQMSASTASSGADAAGFIVNRMLIPMLNEACILVERKIGTIEEIDRGVKLGLHHPMGPLELMDMIGIDVELAVMEVLHEEIGDPKYRPAVSLRRMVDSAVPRNRERKSA